MTNLLILFFPNSKLMILKIVPLGEIDQEIIDFIENEIKKTFKLTVDSLFPREIPEEAYNPFRMQYDATKILIWLRNKFTSKVLGIIEKDIYADNLNFIFGEAEFNGKIAVVSLARLNPEFYREKFDEKLFKERIVKEVFHELGHLFGLEHCKNPKCVMSFSNTILDVDRKSKYFCESCKKKLQEKNVIFRI
ncbi:MAG: archemetzincin [Candidatus Aenigmarchaeota archaeon ex4484_224]|nr:MAG: archemetzincin [Candidatus Aenigmarchaeota archaeon ex4484_224]